jgi:hypothetical protein
MGNRRQSKADARWGTPAIQNNGDFIVLHSDTSFVDFGIKTK